jgi:hypothetical protein
MIGKPPNTTQRRKQPKIIQTTKNIELNSTTATDNQQHKTQSSQLLAENDITALDNDNPINNTRDTISSNYSYDMAK